MIHSSGSSPANAFSNSALPSSTPPKSFSHNTAAHSPPASFSALGNASSPSPPTPANPATTTRILQLTDFSKDIKTRDIQGVFAEWEDDRGGFKIKWIDDTSCLVVFADPLTAKRAFLSVLTNMPPQFAYPANPSQSPAKLRPYSGADVTSILTSVQNRPRSRSNASSHHPGSSSFSGAGMHSRNNSTASTATPGGGVGRRPSMGSMNRNRGGANGSNAQRGASLAQAQVQELIDDITSATTGASSTTRVQTPPSPEEKMERERGAVNVSDAGKRFVAAGLGRNGNGHGRNGSSTDGATESPSTLATGLQGMTIEELPEVATPRVDSTPSFSSSS